MTPFRIIYLAVLAVAAVSVSAWSQTPTSSIRSLVSASEIEALVGTDADAAFVVSDALSRFAGSTGTRTVSVAESQVREYWLPRMPGVRFVRLSDDAMQAHLASCMPRTEVAMTLKDSVLTVKVGEGTECRSSGVYYAYVRVSGAWQRDPRGGLAGFGGGTSHCSCP